MNALETLKENWLALSLAMDDPVLTASRELEIVAGLRAIEDVVPEHTIQEWIDEACSK